MEAIRYQPRYTIADYEQWEGDWELWDGLAVSMSPSANFRHQRLSFLLAKHIEEQLDLNDDCHCTVVYEHDWRISTTTVVRPDVMVVCEPFEGDWVNIPPTLIAEVLSPSTEQKDRTAKRELYAAQGVKHYLMVRLGDGVVEALTLHDGEYAEAADEVELHEKCKVTVPDHIEV